MIGRFALVGMFAGLISGYCYNLVSGEWIDFSDLTTQKFAVAGSVGGLTAGTLLGLFHIRR